MNYDKNNLTDDQVNKLITDNYNLDFLDDAQPSGQSKKIRARATTTAKKVTKLVAVSQPQIKKKALTFKRKTKKAANEQKL